MDITDILAALGVILNGLPQGLLAMSLGYATVPSSLGFFIGAICCYGFNSLAPINFQASTIVMTHRLTKDIREKLSMVFFAGVIMVIVGICGLQQAAVEFSGPVIINAMMAGVGIVLGRLSFEMIKQERVVALSSIISAAIIYFFFGRDLIYTICGCVFISSFIQFCVTKYLKKSVDTSSAYAETSALQASEHDKTPTMQPDESSITSVRDKNIFAHLARLLTAHIKKNFVFKKPIINAHIIRGSLAIACLNVGANITFGNITANIAHGTQNIDILSIYSSLADIASSLFGGSPVEAIISATAAAPHPVNSAVIMMLAMSALLFCGLLPKIGKFIPPQSISGFLIILGIVVTVGNNAPIAFGTGNPQDSIIAAVTLGGTAFVDPFVGMVLGILLKSLFAAGLCM